MNTDEREIIEPPMNANPESARGLAQSKTLRAIRELQTSVVEVAEQIEDWRVNFENIYCATARIK